MTAFSNVPAILAAILADILAPVTALLPGVAVHLDEDLDLQLADLPAVAIYPTEERNNEEFTGDNSSFEKTLYLRIELRVKGTPASLLCTPAINAIVTALQADPTLGGLIANWVGGTVTWATGHLGGGLASGACLELTCLYYPE